VVGTEHGAQVSPKGEKKRGKMCSGVALLTIITEGKPGASSKENEKQYTLVHSGLVGIDG
jgi:hypothetical protein